MTKEILVRPDEPHRDAVGCPSLHRLSHPSWLLLVDLQALPWALPPWVQQVRPLGELVVQQPVAGLLALLPLSVRQQEEPGEEVKALVAQEL